MTCKSVWLCDYLFNATVFYWPRFTVMSLCQGIMEMIIDLQFIRTPAPVQVSQANNYDAAS